MAGRFPTAANVRFSEKCKPDKSGCILWTGGATRIDDKGYGLFYAKGQMRPAHRWLYEQAHGALPSNIDVCHSCDVRKCVNLDHLFAGSRLENMQDAVAKNRTSRKPRVQGEKHPMAKIGESEVLKMRKLFDAGLPVKEIAAYIRTSYMIVYRVVTLKTWKHI
jgi:hypothetical protein